MYIVQYINDQYNTLDCVKGEIYVERRKYYTILCHRVILYCKFTNSHVYIYYPLKRLL